MSAYTHSSPSSIVFLELVSYCVQNNTFMRLYILCVAIEVAIYCSYLGSCEDDGVIGLFNVFFWDTNRFYFSWLYIFTKRKNQFASCTYVSISSDGPRQKGVSLHFIRHGLCYIYGVITTMNLCFNILYDHRFKYFAFVYMRDSTFPFTFLDAIST